MQSSKASPISLRIKDFDQHQDPQFIKEHLTPYMHALFKDLSIRSSTKSSTFVQRSGIDRVVFVEYCQLPGIIWDRFLDMFVGTESQQNITIEQFTQNLTDIFISDLKTKMFFTFRL
jgi:hypothetical protein